MWYRMATSADIVSKDVGYLKVFLHKVIKKPSNLMDNIQILNVLLEFKNSRVPPAALDRIKAEMYLVWHINS